MHTDPDPHAVNPEHIHHPEVSFEKQDLNASSILMFFAVLFISGVAIYLVIWGLYKTFNQIAHESPPNSMAVAQTVVRWPWAGIARYESQPNPMAVAQPAPRSGVLQNTSSVNLNQFAAPRLQQDEPTDMQKLLWQENQVLEAKPWQGQDGAVHIPIEEAMQIVVQRGLRARPDSETQNSALGQAASGNGALSERPGEGRAP